MVGLSFVSRAEWWGRVAVVFAATLYTPAFALNHPRSAAAMDTFLYRVHFVFHEAGHPLFGLFGPLMGALGGTLMQLLIPAACVVAFLRRGDVGAAGLATWWTGTSLATVSPYMYDARMLELPLHGGIVGAEHPEMHDWFNALSRLGLLNQDRTLAWLAQLAAVLLMAGGLGWAARVAWHQRRPASPGSR